MSHIRGQNVSHRRTECLTSEDRMSHIGGQNVSHRRSECLTSEDRMSHMGGQKNNRARFCPNRTKRTEDLCGGGGLLHPPHNYRLGRDLSTCPARRQDTRQVLLHFYRHKLRKFNATVRTSVHHVRWYYSLCLVTSIEHLLFGCVFI